MAEATVTPGKIFQDSEKVTSSKLNQLGKPTVDITGALSSLQVGDGAITNTNIAPGANIQGNKIAIEQGKILIGRGTGSQAFEETLAEGQFLMGGSGDEVDEAVPASVSDDSDIGVTIDDDNKVDFQIANDAVVTDTILDDNVTADKIDITSATPHTPTLEDEILVNDTADNDAVKKATLQTLIAAIKGQILGGTVSVERSALLAIHDLTQSMVTIETKEYPESSGNFYTAITLDHPLTPLMTSGGVAPCWTSSPDVGNMDTVTLYWATQVDGLTNSDQVVLFGSYIGAAGLDPDDNIGATSVTGKLLWFGLGNPAGKAQLDANYSLGGTVSPNGSNVVGNIDAILTTPYAVSLARTYLVWFAAPYAKPWDYMLAITVGTVAGVGQSEAGYIDKDSFRAEVLLPHGSLPAPSGDFVDISVINIV